jgi:hypothetical protein
MLFLTISEFKTRTGATKVDIIRNPNTSKLFAATDKGQNFKVEANINVADPSTIRFMYEDDAKFTEGCICNVKSVKPPIATL